jgi:hypothetical protein
MLTFDGKNAIEYWKKFKKVKVNVSFDDIAERAEYTRYGTKWDNMKKNMDIIYDHFGFLRINLVFSIFNALYIYDIIEYICKNYGNFKIIASFLTNDVKHRASLLPKEARELVCEQIKRAEVLLSQHPIGEVFRLNLLGGLMETYKNELDDAKYLECRKKFIESTDYVDSIRKESFDETFPEISKFIRDPRFLTDASY